MHTCVVHDAYDEGSPQACRWLTGKAHMTGIKGAPYRRRLDALSATDVCWMPYGEHWRVRAFDLISSYTGQLRWGQIVVYVRPEWVLRQFGYLQMVPPPPICDSLTGDDIDDRWLNFPDHLVPSGELCVVPGQVAPDYMEWFFWISHPFVTRGPRRLLSRDICLPLMMRSSSSHPSPRFQSRPISLRIQW